MTTQILKTGILCSAVLASAVAGMLTSTAAQARGKEFLSQDYQFNQAVHGFQGQQGSYYCSYQRIPHRVCDRSGNCKVEGWTLRQYCY